MRYILLVVFSLLLSCSQEQKPVLPTENFVYNDEFMDFIDQFVEISSVFKIDDEIPLVSTNKFIITNRYIVPFFYYFYSISPSFNEDITRADILTFIKHTSYEMALKELKFIEADENGIKVTDDEVADTLRDMVGYDDLEEYGKQLEGTPFTVDFFLDDIQRDLMTNRYLDEFYFNEIVINDEMIFDYYKQNKSVTLKEPEITCRHIFIRALEDDEHAVERALEKIAMIHNKLKSGEDFIKLVHQYSEDEATISSDGLLGSKVTRGSFIERVERAVFSTNEGEISEIVQSPVGFHIFKVESIKHDGRYTLDESKDLIKEILTNNKKELLEDAFINRLIEESDIKFEFDFDKEINRE